MGWSIYSIQLLKLIPGLDLTILDSHCCGIAGTYGFKKENYERSQKIGAPLFEQIKAVNPDSVATDCETCKWQIEMSTGYPVDNPVSLLAETLDVEETRKLNEERTDSRSQHACNGGYNQKSGVGDIASNQIRISTQEGDIR